MMSVNDWNSQNSKDYQNQVVPRSKSIVVDNYSPDASTNLKGIIRQPQNFSA